LNTLREEIFADERVKMGEFRGWAIFRQKFCPFDPHFSAISTLFTQREKEKKKKSNFADRAKIREIKFREDFLRKNFFPKGNLQSLGIEKH